MLTRNLLGMASRLALNLGLDRDSTYTSLTRSEQEVYQAALFGCLCLERLRVIHPPWIFWLTLHRYWALVLKRSPTVKKIDLKLLQLSLELLTMKTNGRAGPPMAPPFDVSATLKALVYTTESMQKSNEYRRGHLEFNDPFMTSTLQGELNYMYRSLPNWAKYSASNVQSGGSDFFLFQ